MSKTTDAPTNFQQIATEAEVELRRARLASALMGRPLLTYVLDMALLEFTGAKTTPDKPTPSTGANAL